ncbi:uncharacterized protein K489DRAFT_377111 [Dissoconium aciculare CBS 342.82]|uniref:Uncharacterized protein n=1 Tax=Dissoconium aciculare CBS 342.82 TaxID=1314786 RepID=A0A6J3MIE1_9PEZI|nr:uncharacterized protein K489DRAFT_377111 [Dissoconium aciculare CBS 342.82]KAF1826677.1 hypothetical protein K489DRAFT_377111 [Dissoconium aciculare CBS 342.82]
MSKDDALYGLKRPRNLTEGQELSSTKSLSFGSQLSSLIATSTSSAGSSRSATKARPRPSSTKDDIFKKHNGNTAKRAKRDLEPDHAGAFQQSHTTNGEGVDRDILEVSKRKMQQKARLYAAMQRGDLEDVDGKYAVDFDGKWAAAQDRKSAGHGREHDDDDDDDSDDSDDPKQQEKIEYIDEFGRTRTGTRLEAAIAAQQASNQTEVLTARPAAPTNLIYGDTVQSNAFAPDADRIERMADLAAKRDRSLTPPPKMHFDSKAELRTRGTGFFGFSQDEETRNEQMSNMEKERLQTERIREAREKDKETEKSAREKMLQERREQVQRRRDEVEKRRAKRLAGEFLEGLVAEEQSRSALAKSSSELAAGEDDKGEKRITENEKLPYTSPRTNL